MICFIIRKKFPIDLYRLIQSLWGSWWQTYMDGDIIQEGEAIFLYYSLSFYVKIVKMLGYFKIIQYLCNVKLKRKEIGLWQSAILLQSI